VSGSVAAIVLAAGASRRLGQPKQLLMHGGETLLDRAIRLIGEAGAPPILVVLGADHERIRANVNMRRAIPVINDKWELGIATSIHAGLAALDAIAPEAAGTVVMSCDQPRLTAEHLSALIGTFCAQSVPSIAASVYAGVRGIPAVFPRQAFADLLALSGDRGARALLASPPCPVIEVDFHGGEIDIDTPEDLAQIG
jgi:molybdenum cofactor cytidylyltransferase